MTASFRRIDYSLRPAKYAERRMLSDVFRRLRPFQPVEEYLYVGFGSVWFSDFILFHKALGIRDMISIEQAERTALRIIANKPFRIHIDFRSSSKVLPELDWKRRQLLWLDYDDPLSPDMLLDARTVAGNAMSGTVVALSVQCMRSPDVTASEADDDPNGPSALARFRQRFGRERVPQEVQEDDLMGWPYGKVCRAMLLAEIEAALAVCNSDGKPDEMKFKTICEFEYEDGAKMKTLVGIFYRDSDAATLDQCGFDKLEFLTPGGRPVRIPVPKLTTREFRSLESQLPLKNGAELELGEIPAAEAKFFAEMYRYLPNFAVIES